MNTSKGENEFIRSEKQEHAISQKKNNKKSSTRAPSKLGKEYIKAVHCHPVYLTYMQSTIMRNTGLEEAQAGIKIAGRNINNLRYADDTILWQKAKKN